MTDTSKKQLTAVIADDEFLARAYLKELLGDFTEIRVVGEAANGLKTVEMVETLRPDVLFLDIQMPKLDGFEVLQALERDPPQVVFVTAYDEYALKAFEVNAVDYLLKPFPKQRLRDAVDRLLATPGRKIPNALSLDGAAERAGSALKRIVIKDGDRVRIIPVDDIDAVTSEGDYVAVHANGESLLKLQTIRSMEKVLDPARFVRIHRSAILNLESLDQIVSATKDAKQAHLKNGEILPISREGYKLLMARLAP